MRRLAGWFAMTVLLVMACKESAPPAEGQVPAANGAAEAKGVKSDKQFTIEVQAPKAKAGEKGEIQVVIKAADGYHWNVNYPSSFKIGTVPASVKLDKAEFDASAFQAKENGPQATLAVPFQAASAGSASLEGTASFSVCNDEACLVFRNEKVAWTVQVD